MKQKRYKAEQIVSILKDAESGVPLTELRRKYSFSENTFFRWKKKYGGLDSSEVANMRAMSQENAQLKKLVANQALQIDTMKEALGKKW